jgi:cellulase/cellobiase CelA1
MRRRLRTGVLVAGLSAHVALAATGLTVLTIDLSPPFVRAEAAVAAPPRTTTAVPDGPAPGCQVIFTVRDRWPTGFTADLVVTNDGPPLTGWELRYTAPGRVRVVHGWNGVWTEEGDQISIRNVGWNATIGTGTSVKAGLSAAVTGTAPPPTDFVLNDVLCR